MKISYSTLQSALLNYLSSNLPSDGATSAEMLLLKQQAHAYFANPTSFFSISEKEMYKHSFFPALLLQHVQSANTQSDQPPQTIDYRSIEAQLTSFLTSLSTTLADVYPVVFYNGTYLEHFTPSLPAYLQLTQFTPATTQHSSHLKQYLNLPSSGANHLFAQLNTACFSEGIFIRLSGERQLEKPIVLFSITDQQAPPLIFPRILFVVEPHSQLTCFQSGVTVTDTTSTLENTLVEMHLHENAQLQYYSLESPALHYPQVNNLYSYQHKGSVFKHTVLSCSPIKVRNNVSTHLLEPESSTELYGMYTLKDSEKVENYTLISHQAPHTESKEHYKGILTEKSFATFNGKIYVHPTAQKTQAFQRNDVLLLSPQATLHTKPELEIFADDVKCSHGATCGALSEEAIFYLRSRGLAPLQASQLLCNAFLNSLQHHLQPAIWQWWTGYIKTLFNS